MPQFATRLVTTVTVLIMPLVLIISTWGSFPATPPEFYMEPEPVAINESPVSADSTPGQSADVGKARKKETRRGRAATHETDTPVAATPFIDAIVPNP